MISPHACFLMAAVSSLVMLSSLTGASGAALPVKAVASENGVEVYVDSALFTRYKTESSQKYPYFFPVNGPVSGLSVTTETSEPYPHHHSLFFGCDRVNGGNYWQDALDKGQICSTALKILEQEGDRVVIENQCEWRKPEEAPILRDTRLIYISAPSETLRIIDFDITLVALTDIHVERTNHSLFAARMVPELSVNAGGTLVNARGDKGEADTFGKASFWCDYYGSRDNTVEGLAILQHPVNPMYPVQWFTRDYGFFSPTPLNWLEAGVPLELKQNKSLTLRYRVIVHAGDTECAGIAECFSQYTAEGASVQPAE